MAITKAKIQGNLRRIRENIASACAKSGRSESEVTIIAVTKLVDIEPIKILVDMGLTEFGESRAQQIAERAAELDAWLQRRRSEMPAVVRWHLVGHLQRNKVKTVLPVAAMIHSIDSLRLAEEINARAERENRTIDVLLQVNCSQESQKSGCAVGATSHLAELISTLKSVRLTGLMTMAAAGKHEDARPAFSLLRELFDEIRNEKIGGEHFRHLSMGMSQDYTVAVEEGATLLRIGSALFQ